MELGSLCPSPMLITGHLSDWLCGWSASSSFPPSPIRGSLHLLVSPLLFLLLFGFISLVTSSFVPFSQGSPDGAKKNPPFQ